MTTPILLTLLAALAALALALLSFAGPLGLGRTTRRRDWSPSAALSLSGGFFGGLLAAVLVISVFSGAVNADDSKNGIVIGEEFDAPKGQTKEKPLKELSVNPGEFAPKDMFPEDRPEWVSKTERNVDGVDIIVINSGPHYRPQECQRHLDKGLREAVDQYIDDYLDKNHASKLVSYDLKTIKRRLVSHDPADQYDGPVNTSVGTYHEEVRVLKFDQDFRNELDHRWVEVVSKSRLLSVALLGGGVFGLLLVFFGFLKVDNATRGFYTGRLQAVTIMTILTMIVVGVMIARWIPWM